MEILPGVGIDDVQIGNSRQVVDGRLGKPAWSRESRCYYEPLGVLVHYDDALVELVEVPYRDDGSEQPSLGGVALTHDYMEHVVQQLTSQGHVGEPTDIGYAFAAGFAIFLMSSLSPSDLDPTADDDDERLIVEGGCPSPRTPTSPTAARCPYRN